MNYSQMSADALTKIIGERLRRYRLNKNMSHAQLTEISGLNRQKIARAESGKATLETVMALMIGLEMTDHLDAFLPPTPISPIQLAKLKGKERKRASRSRVHHTVEFEGDDDLGW
ncbi:helix-turn-helix transcriptional regulator [Vibrio breoganii]